MLSHLSRLKQEYPPLLRIPMLLFRKIRILTEMYLKNMIMMNLRIQSQLNRRIILTIRMRFRQLRTLFLIMNLKAANSLALPKFQPVRNPCLLTVMLPQIQMKSVSLMLMKTADLRLLMLQTQLMSLKIPRLKLTKYQKKNSLNLKISVPYQVKMTRKNKLLQIKKLKNLKMFQATAKQLRKFSPLLQALKCLTITPVQTIKMFLQAMNQARTTVISLRTSRLLSVLTIKLTILKKLKKKTTLTITALKMMTMNSDMQMKKIIKKM